ncbi:MAG: YitT family protein [Eubacterium sp.]|nr:YitT family protein [Eubacterium sp.]
MKQLLSKETFISWILLTAGAILAAFALEEFLVPNDVFDGGIVGVSMILAHFLPLKLGILMVIINIPFLLIGLRKLGKLFVLKVTYSMILFSVMTEVFAPFMNATYDVFLGCIFGGILLGAGVGLVLRGGGCLDGTEVVAIILNRRVQFSTGQIILIINIVIYTIAGALFGLDRGMYSLVMYFITSKIIDLVEIGGNNTKSVMIITDDGRELADKIFQELGRTVTFLKGEGFISSETKDILYCVVTRAEIHDLKKVISRQKGSTFTTISEVSEIIGRHIKSTEQMIEMQDTGSQID